MISKQKIKFMKRFTLIAFLFAAPLAVMAQVAVFTDNFSNGSTVNGNDAAVLGGTPTASKTSYDLGSSKTATNSIAAGHLKIGLSGTTTSGFWEAQALFTATPVTLATVGDYVTLTYTFTNTSSLLAGGTSSAIYTGLYNSGGSAPVAGNLAATGLNTNASSAFATGNAANWQGYVSRIVNAAASEAYTRPLQNGAGTTSANQELIGNNFGGGAFNNPTGVVFDATETATVALTAGARYTNSYTIALTAAGTLTVTNNLFDATGALIFSQTNTASGSTNLTQSFDGLCIGARNSGSPLDPVMDINQITVTKSIFGSPGPSFTVSGGGAGCPGDSFAVNLSGSVSSNAYYLVTNGVVDGAVAPQTGNGSALVFGPVSVIGTNSILASNTVSGYTGLMSGSAVTSILPGPGIATQPSPVIVATNYAGVFTVAATGGGLGYQWYRNGTVLADGGHISGSQTSTLTISPATTADAATAANGYYVVITNACGLQTNSITNSLTLDTPANLTWTGGNPNTNWDLATTANWNSGAAKFNSGDNVVFDDSSTNPVVTMVGNLDPTSVTYSASQNYFLRGSGSLVGAGSMLVNGSGTLNISNVSTYTYSGGTVISNGTVAIRTAGQQSLGTGPVTLAGGTLEVGVASGSATSGLSNSINVTASSTLKWDGGAGTYTVVLFSPLSGSPGATLTLQNFLNNSATPDRIRLYAAFTNDSPMVINTAGNEIDLAVYLSSGNQVYNGLISGSGGRFVLRGNGNLILNNGGNTFNDSGVNASGAGASGYSVYFSGGNLGIGADSVSSSPPMIDSSPLGTGNLGINVGVEGGDCTLFASGAAHTVGNPINYTSSTNSVVLSITGTNALNLSGSFQLSLASDLNGTNRTINVNAPTILSGVVSDNGLGSGIIKTGTNVLYLDATNTYIGSTIVSNGTLAGSGVISGPLAIASTGTISGGNSGVIGTLTVSNNLTIGGNLLIRVNKSLSPAQSNDTIYVSSGNILTNSGTGTLTVSNLGTSLVAGDRFAVFNTPLLNGSAITITPAPGAGLSWSNKLAVDGSISVISSGPVTPLLQTAPTASTITNGNALSTSTLSGGVVTNTAGATVSGVFTFATPSTVPPLGTSSQLVTFLPGDTSDYNSFTFNVSVTVVPAPSVTSIQFTGKPVISGTSLIISATNTGAGTIYLLNSTNVAAHLNTWTPIWTNTLGGSGSFTTNLSNAVNPAQNQNFYILSTTNN